MTRAAHTATRLEPLRTISDRMHMLHVVATAARDKLSRERNPKQRVRIALELARDARRELDELRGESARAQAHVLAAIEAALSVEDAWR